MDGCVKCATFLEFLCVNLINPQSSHEDEEIASQHRKCVGMKCDDAEYKFLEVSIYDNVSLVSCVTNKHIFDNHIRPFKVLQPSLRILGMLPFF